MLPQSRVRSRLHLLDGIILWMAAGKLHTNVDRQIKNSIAYTMATIYNCIAESESGLEELDCIVKSCDVGNAALRISVKEADPLQGNALRLKIYIAMKMYCFHLAHLPIRLL